MKLITLTRKLETLKIEDIIYLLKDVMDHEEIKRSEKHMEALTIILDLLEYPNPQAWRVSSDSDVLRCPNCKIRVPGDNPWRKDENYVKPMNIFCQHADSIYQEYFTYVCPGCNKELEVVPKKDGKWNVKNMDEGVEVILKEVIKEIKNEK